MTEVRPWAWVNRDTPWHGVARSACLPMTRHVNDVMTKVLEKLKGCPVIVDHLGTLET